MVLQAVPKFIALTASLAMLRYAITNRTLYPALHPISEGQDGSLRHAALVDSARRWAVDQIDFIQLREKDLPAGELVLLARAMLAEIRETGSATRLLINSRPDIALASGAHGVHLPSGIGQLTPAQVRTLFQSNSAEPVTISVSCHTLDDVNRARSHGADLILFGPIFGKSVMGRSVLPGIGLDLLHAASERAREIPVLALGGITGENSRDCLAAGAAGIAAIRLFSPSSDLESRLPGRT